MYLEIALLLFLITSADAGNVDERRRNISPSGTASFPSTNSFNTRDVYVDVVVLIDYSVYQWFYVKTDHTKHSLRRQETVLDLEQTFDKLINAVHQHFKTASSRFHINLAGYFIEDDGPGDWLRNASDGNAFQLDGRLLLDSAWNWTRILSGFPENDHIVVFTAHDLYATEDNEYINIAGIAYDGTLCNPRGYSMSLLEYRDQLEDDAIAVAHEIGHSFGSRHDGESNQCSSSDHYIMSSYHITGYAPSQYTSSVFSPCSILYFKDHIDYITSYRDSKSLSCLYEPIKPSVSYLLPLKPGVKYDVHKQCQMIYGLRSYYCGMNTGPPASVCKGMTCYNPRLGRCTYHHAAEGTSCGNKKWCVGKQCIYSAEAPEKHAECIFGNRPGIIYQGKDCDTLMTGRKHLCYSQQNRRLCCDTCLRLANGPPGCEYGDNLWSTSFCNRNKCRTGGRQYSQLCCQTCAPPTTTAATITTTTTTTTPTTTVTPLPPPPTTTSTTSSRLSTAVTTAHTSSPVGSTSLGDTISPDTIASSTSLVERISPDTVVSSTLLIAEVSPDTVATTTSLVDTISPETVASSTALVDTVSPDTVASSTSLVHTVSPDTVASSTALVHTVSPETVASSTALVDTVSPDTVASSTSLVDTVNPDTVALSTLLADTANGVEIKLDTVDDTVNTVNLVLKPSTPISDYDNNDYVTVSFISGKTTLSSSQNTVISSHPRESHIFGTAGHCADNATLQLELNTSCTNINDDIPISRCYDVDYISACCQTCRVYHMGIAGCEFGDRDTDFCPTIDRLSCCDYRSTCCDTCREDLEPLMCFYSRGSPRKLHELYIPWLIFLLVFMF